MNLWDSTLVVPLTLYIFLYALIHHKNEISMRVPTRKANGFPSSFTVSIHYLQAVLPHPLKSTLSSCTFYVLYCIHMCLCLHILIYYWLDSSYKREHTVFFFLRLCDLNKYYTF